MWTAAAIPNQRGWCGHGLPLMREKILLRLQICRPIREYSARNNGCALRAARQPDQAIARQIPVLMPPFKPFQYSWLRTCTDKLSMRSRMSGRGLALRIGAICLPQPGESGPFCEWSRKRISLIWVPKRGTIRFTPRPPLVKESAIGTLPHSRAMTRRPCAAAPRD